jgi:hypothetical protein
MSVQLEATLRAFALFLSVYFTLGWGEKSPPGWDVPGDGGGCRGGHGSEADVLILILISSSCFMRKFVSTLSRKVKVNSF